MTKDAGAEALGRITTPELGTICSRVVASARLFISAFFCGRFFHLTNNLRAALACLPSRCCATLPLLNGSAEPHQARMRSIVTEPHLGPPPRRVRDGEPRLEPHTRDGSKIISPS